MTRADKVRALEREIRMRRRVYPGWVRSGRMKQAEADHEIAAMQAILDDYRGGGDLFDRAGDHQNPSNRPSQ